MSLSADTFTFVADLVRRRSAIDLTVGKESLVESRLMPLVRQAGLAGVDEYVGTVRERAHGVEHDRIVEALTTNETWWFRDLGSFRALSQQIIPTLVQDNPGLGPLRIWSAACSTGQEPYSIAMALVDAAPDLAVEITATDLSREVLSRGRAGRYSQIEVNRGLPVSMLVRHFTRAGTEWELSEQVRSVVTFSQHNLLGRAPPGGPFDIVYLRNVLIYFDRETKERVISMVSKALRPGGFLLLGPVETTMGNKDIWDSKDVWEQLPVGRGSIYRLIPKGAA